MLLLSILFMLAVIGICCYDNYRDRKRKRELVEALPENKKAKAKLMDDYINRV